ncbi:IclR family transcriptional regulator [Defluviitalea phaphyphila]|uniref:IclR family transcriptional regulator n=1 Tax=Defluviitalea phaphyphila TaxID=1473580 RepID=UPI000731575E|nr:IclR family transcriptional regulator [Defluviitalea phaphyphila]
MASSRAAKRTIQILELISEKPKGITLSEISNELDIPISSTKDIIQSLLELEMIEIIDKRSKLYGIGVKAYYIGSSFIRNTTIIDKARVSIEKLGTVLNKTIFLGKEINGKITYIYKYEPENLLVATCPIGKRTFLHSTALGKCFLAYNEELLKKVLNKPLVKETRFTITDKDQLMEEIAKVRINGYAVDRREQAEHLLCIAAPIFDHSNKIVAALSASGLYKKNIDIEKEASIIMKKASEISMKLGYRR